MDMRLRCKAKMAARLRAKRTVRQYVVAKVHNHRYRHNKERRWLNARQISVRSRLLAVGGYNHAGLSL